MFVRVGDRRIVLPPQTHVEGEIRAYFPVVLEEQRILEPPHMPVIESRGSRHGVDQAGHLQRSVIGESEDVGETVTGDIVDRVDRVRRIPPELTTYFDRVRFFYPGKGVLVV